MKNPGENVKKKEKSNTDDKMLLQGIRLFRLRMF